jgi:hypothetical protein
MGCLEYFRRWGGDSDHASVFVETDESLHTCLGKELNVLLGVVTTNHGAAFSADKGGRVLGAAVLWTDEEGLCHIVTACLDFDMDTSLTAGILGPPPFSGFAQGLVETFAWLHDDVAGMTDVARQDNEE